MGMTSTEARDRTPGRRRVLVVEDVPVIAHFMTRTLERVGYEARAVHDGDEALGAVRDFAPHAVILDVLLPGLSGIEICRRIRADDALAGLVVIFATGHAFDDDACRELYDAGANWHLSKPVRPSALLEKLAELGLPPEIEDRPGSAERDLRAYEEVAATLFGSFDDLAVAVLLPDDARWIRGEPTEGALTATIRTGEEECDLQLAAPAARGDLLAAGRKAAHAWAPLVRLTRERDGLAHELGVAYESLTTIYEIGSDQALLADSDLALARIVQRAASVEAGLCATLWLVKEDGAHAVQHLGTTCPAPRPPSGILASVLAGSQGRIWNDYVAEPETEPELAAARRVAAAPLLRGDEAVGALVVWSETRGLFDSSHLALMTSLLGHMGMVLEQDRLRRDLVAGERIRRELEVGGEIQRLLLFGHVPKQLTSVDIGLFARPSRSVGGDFFAIYDQGEGIVDVLVGDVMGKGLPAALVGAAVKGSFDRHASAARFGGAAAHLRAPRDIVAAVHRDVAEHLVQLRRFATLTYARLDPRGGSLTIVDCGHPPVLRVRADDVEALAFDYPGRVNLPLGFHAEGSYEQVAVPLDGGDRLLLYSDGFTEAADDDGEMYGETRLADAFLHLEAENAEDATESLHTAIDAFAAGGRPDDDLTCAVLHVPERSATRSPVLIVEFPAVQGHLHLVRDLLQRSRRQAAPNGLEPASWDLLEVAAIEAVTNVVRHAYDADDAGPVRVEIREDEQGLILSVLDRGRPFRPGTIPVPMEDEARGGGFGLLLMQGILDEVEYERGAGGLNRLTLCKRFATRTCERMERSGS